MKFNCLQLDCDGERILLKLLNKDEQVNELAAIPYTASNYFCKAVYAKICDRDCLLRFNCTEYTLADLAYAFKTADYIMLETIAKTLPAFVDFKFSAGWYDPIEHPESYDAFMTLLRPTLIQCLVATSEVYDVLDANYFVGTLSPDNQNLNGHWLDFGDFTKCAASVVMVDTYYSYIMPLLGAARVFTDVFDHTNYKGCYDYSDEKRRLFLKYFKGWSGIYHPNCHQCLDEMCVLHCANYNILLSMYINPKFLGPITGIFNYCEYTVPVCIGHSSVELGIVYNNDSLPEDDILRLMLIYGTPPIHVAASTPYVNNSTSLYTAGFIKHMSTRLDVPAYIDTDFYEHCRDILLHPGSTINLKHFYFLVNRDSASSDFDLYRHNRPTVFDIKQFQFVYKVVQKYFEPYDAKCLPNEDVIVNSPNKSSGFPFNTIANAGGILEYMQNIRVDKLFAWTKRNVLATLTKVNLKNAISAKDRVRTVAGVSILSTCTNRCAHQHLLKNIAATRDATVVIGTPKFYGNWDTMLRRFMDGENRNLIGWDYPKCDRSMPNLHRIAAAWLFLNKHTSCCNHTERFYRLVNEHAQVISETCLVDGALLYKPGGTSSGDATTAYANSVFNLFQVVTASVQHMLKKNVPDLLRDVKVLDSNSVTIRNYRDVVHNIYECIYLCPYQEAVQQFYDLMLKVCPLMILSDDGVAAPMVEHPFALTLDDFKGVLFSQNNVVLTSDKCWTQSDLTKGPEEFCSQHTIFSEGSFYPVPDPSRIIAACIFVSKMEPTTDSYKIERLVSLAIDAWPLTLHHDENYKRVFPVILDFINKCADRIQDDVSFDVPDCVNVTPHVIRSESFYRNMYVKSAMLQAGATMCVVCQIPTILSCSSCVRPVPLCCMCMYHHVATCNHHRVATTTVMCCNHRGCACDDVNKLYFDGKDGLIRCLDHVTSTITLPIMDPSSETIFSLGRDKCVPNGDIHVFNQAILDGFSKVANYDTFGKPYHLKCQELVRAMEEIAKKEYGCATITNVYKDGAVRCVTCTWSGTIPPISVNSKFLATFGKMHLGEFVLARCGSAYSYTSNSNVQLRIGSVLKLVCYGVESLLADPLPRIPLYPVILHTDVIPPDYNSHAQRTCFDRVRTSYLTMVQGPPGTGKSFLLCGLAQYFSKARIMYVANSHAAVDSICVKLQRAGLASQCTRIKSFSSQHHVFAGFDYNDTSKRIICTTINSMPRVMVDIMVVDEISMCTDADLSTVNFRVNYKRIVYCGDPAQLSAPRTLLLGELPPRMYNSITRTMVDHGPHVFLDTCYRCPAPVVHKSSALCYNGRLVPHTEREGKCYSILYPGTIRNSAGSKFGVLNHGQITVAANFIKAHPEFSSAIFISPYHLQNGLAAEVLGLRTSTVEASQGQEYDYVIYSQTAATSFALNLQRFNVALTRCKLGIFIIATRAEFDIFSSNFSNTLQADDFFFSPVPVSCESKHLTFKGAEHSINSIPPEQIRSFLNGAVALDMEFVHATDGSCAQYLVQLGVCRYIPLSFAIKPTAVVMTESGVAFRELAYNQYRYPPRFQHLRSVVRRGHSLDVALTQLFQYLATNTSGPIVFVTWCATNDIRQLPLFCRQGPVQYCKCRRVAVFINGNATIYTCQDHYDAITAKFLYNVSVSDIRDVHSNLGDVHGSRCSRSHGQAHDAGCDAAMTMCYYTQRFIASTIDWSFLVPRRKELNSKLRYMQKLIINSVCPPSASILDVGNPTGYRTTSHTYHCIDANPVSTRSQATLYKQHMAGDYDYCLFWNCNITLYPANAIVCRLTKPELDKSVTLGPNGSLVYSNKHIFYQSGVYSVENLVPWRFTYTSTEPCSGDTQSFNIPLGSFYTMCYKNGYCCNFHGEEYFTAKKCYDYIIATSGFRFYVPAVRRLVSHTPALQSINVALANIIAGFPSIKSYQSTKVVVSDFQYVNNCIYYKNRLIFDDRTSPLVGFDALESFMYRCVVPIVTNTVLHGLGVTCIAGYSNYGLCIDACTASGCKQDIITDCTSVVFSIGVKHSGAFSRNYVLSSSKLASNSRKFESNTLPMWFEGKPLFNANILYLTCYVYQDSGAVTVDTLKDTLFSLGRTLDTFTANTEVERDYMALSANDFLSRYALNTPGYKHVLYGDFDSSTIGGVHLLISLVRGRTDGMLYNEYTLTPTSAVRTVSVVKGSSSKFTTFVDVDLGAFIGLLKALPVDIVSKVSIFSIDYQPIRFMEWAANGAIATFYPLPSLQSQTYAVHKVPLEMLCADRGPIEPINIGNYGDTVHSSIVDGVGANYMKYMQVFQYLNNCTTTPFAQDGRLRILNLGAASRDGRSPGSDAIRSFTSSLCNQHTRTTLHDLDVVSYTSSADMSIVCAIESFKPQLQYDIIFSDIYNLEGTPFHDVCRVIRTALSAGGTFVVKCTETQFSEEVLLLCGDCIWWGCVFTCVNASSSEYYLVGVNYIPNSKRSLNTLPSMHNFRSNYAWYRNNFIFKPSIYSLFALRQTAKGSPTVIFEGGADYKNFIPHLASGNLLFRRPLTETL